MPKRTYVGPHDAVEVTLDGVERTVAYGEAVDVPEGQAERLDAQEGCWAKPQAKAAREARDEARDGA